jgi:hypothetical protein
MCVVLPSNRCGSVVNLNGCCRIRGWNLFATFVWTLLLMRFPLGLLSAEATVDKGSPDFDTEVRPLLVKHCVACHSGSAAKGGLDLTNLAAATKGGESGVAIVPGNVEKSLLWTKISLAEMPPEKPLDEGTKSVLRRWITSGAQWGAGPIDLLGTTTDQRAGYDWWALQPIQRPAVPESGESGGNPIDAFVRKRLAENGLTPATEAEPRDLIRRWYFDLTGLPPAPEEVQAFREALGNQGTAQGDDVIKMSVVDLLLASRHYGERWGRHWLDVVRFGESQGFERDKLRPDAWHYRDWVIQAFNDAMPYDEFVRLQLAGDVLYPSDAAAVTATGFLVAGPWDEVGQSQRSPAMKAIVRQDEIEDYVGTLSQTFLGLTVNCARCHDHKFDPITQREYYQLASAVSGARHGSREVTAKSGSDPYSIYAVTPQVAETAHLLERGNPATPGEVVRPSGVAAIQGTVADFGLAADAPDGERRTKLAEWIASDQNPLFARVIVNRLWHYHFGMGIVETPNDFGFNGGRPSHPELLDWLAAELVESGWKLKHIHRLIVTSRTYGQDSKLRPECAKVDAGNRLLWRRSPARLEAEILRDSILSVSGQLNLQYGGAPYQDFETYTSNSQFYTPTDPDTPDANRRTVYRTWIRSGRNHLLDAFDCPDPSTTAPQRAVTTTPIQSLALMNGSFVLRMSDRFAARVEAELPGVTAAQVDRVFQLAYGRLPAIDRRVTLTEFVQTHGLSALCRVVLNSNEFIHVD